MDENLLNKLVTLFGEDYDKSIKALNWFTLVNEVSKEQEISFDEAKLVVNLLITVKKSVKYNEFILKTFAKVLTQEL